MVKSFLDNDLYKFTMSQAYWLNHRDTWVNYRLIFRRKDSWTTEAKEFLLQELQKLQILYLTYDEYEFLKNTGLFVPEYLVHLKNLCLSFERIHFHYGNENSPPEVEVMGPAEVATLYEVPILATVSEVLSKYKWKNVNDDISCALETQKYQEVLAPLVEKGAKVFDFGTRRRFSFNNHKRVLETYGQYFAGTSNCLFAKMFGMLPVGTVAHEWYSVHGALSKSFAEGNAEAQRNWRNVYKDKLNIALPDTFTTDLFLAKMPENILLSLDGFRQDSGSPIEFVQKVFQRMKGLTDPTRFKYIFSDGLSFEKIALLETQLDVLGVKNRSYGIGTNVTNDLGVQPPNIVMKAVNVSRFVKDKLFTVPCIKLSDTKGKEIGPVEEIERARLEIKTREID